MQQLHLVGVTTDHESLIFSIRKGAKSGSFVLPLDEHLLGALAEAVRRRNAEGVELELPIEIDAPSPVPRRSSQLSPREIQDRLRAGRSLSEIASEAGVGEEWVARFAAPVDAERKQIVNRARSLVYHKPRQGDSGETLGLSVRWNLAERGVRLTNDEFDDAWSGYQLTDQTWMVTFSFTSRNRLREAEWELDLDRGELVSRNRLATDLGYTEPGRRRRSVTSLQPMGPSKSNLAEDAPTSDGEPAAKSAGPGGRSKASKAQAVSKSNKGLAPRKSTPVKKAVKKAVPVKKLATGTRVAPIRKSAVPRKIVPAPRKAPARKATASRKASAKRSKANGASTATKKGAPPAPAVASAAARPVPNELSQRRLQIIAAANAAQPSGGMANRSSRPTAKRPAPPAEERAARPGRSSEAAVPAKPDPEARSSNEAKPEEASVRAPRGDRPPREMQPEPRKSENDAADREAGTAEDEAAEARRVERRRARADARTPEPDSGGADSDLPRGDGRVVTIRANRATTRSESEAGVPSVPRPPLRRATPPRQSRRRRFGRSDR